MTPKPKYPTTPEKGKNNPQPSDDNHGWISVKDRLPPCAHTVLAYKLGDLYPAVAFWLPGDKDKPSWMHELEGPEEGAHQDYRPLYAEPTHWMELPETPLDPSWGAK